MPKTIAIAPSWYWPPGVPRVMGVPPFGVHTICVARHARNRPSATALIDDAGQLTFGQLEEEVSARAGALAAAAGEGRSAVLPGAPTRENVIELLAGLAAGVRLRIVAPGVDAAAVARQTGAVVAGSEGRSPGSVVPGVTDTTLPAVIFEASPAPVLHSNRSLLAMAISMATFVDAEPGRPWITFLPLSRWEGVMAALIPLFLGVPLVLPPAKADADAQLGLISRHNAGYTVAAPDVFAKACREAKRSAKDARRMLRGALLAVDGPFDPHERRRVEKALECPTLTFWGMPETGPIFASHPSWYMDESIGLPMTNAHVVPVEPRTGQPIAALWELVDSAEVSVFTPSFMCGYEGDAPAPQYWGSHYRTGMLASSDANGMVYLLGR